MRFRNMPQQKSCPDTRILMEFLRIQICKQLLFLVKISARECQTVLVILGNKDFLGSQLLKM